MIRNVSSTEIRETFLDFFTKRGHMRIPRASLIPINDPTLLYVNSGMAPLKKYFLGEEKPPAPNLCNVQPCFRTSDIGDVGDRQHLTLFEMMGSWSIDNYYKQRAIELAYELLVDHFGFAPDRLYATVFQGNPKLNLPPDYESAAAWESVGLSRDRIVWLGEDNFWGPAGDFGPCGPCTEVFFDYGDRFGAKYVPGGFFDSKRYLEVWNAGVFMELNKTVTGEYLPLPFKSVDTGSGVERMAMTLNGYESAYETDLLRPTMDIVQEALSGSTLTIADHRVMADHVRAVTFILAEKVKPSNEGRGYIPRRLIRRCLAIARRADRNVPFAEMVDSVVQTLGDQYPQLKSERQTVLLTLEHERREFEKAVGRGLDRLERLVTPAPFRLSGKEAFDLFSTYGIPLDLLRDAVQDRGGELDVDGFQREFQRHQSVSQARGRQVTVPELPDAHLPATTRGGRWPKTRFVGYSRLTATARTIAILTDGLARSSADAGDLLDLVTDVTPFYAEAGGQVGDRGLASWDGGSLEVTGTRKTADGRYYLHQGRVERGRLEAGQLVELRVDAGLRRQTAANHSATHLLNAALRTTLGSHVRQAGSLVEPARLRFDFDHSSALTREELEKVERLVNEYIRRNLRRRTTSKSYQEAVAGGALAFFGEQYGQVVRVVQFGDVSSELCGGTHVEASGEIGLFKLVTEGSVGAGVRRIVAVTGEAAVDRVIRQDEILRKVAAELGVGVDQVTERVASLTKQARRPGPASRRSGIDARTTAVDSVETLEDGTRYVALSATDSGAALNQQSRQLASEIDGVVFLWSAAEESDVIRIAVAVPNTLTNRYDASAIVRQLAPLINGRGGGNRHVAEAGGSDLTGVAELPRRFVETLAKRAPSTVH